MMDDGERYERNAYEYDPGRFTKTDR